MQMMQRVQETHIQGRGGRAGCSFVNCAGPSQVCVFERAAQKHLDNTKAPGHSSQALLLVLLT
jgi:hypothetical protein